MRVGDAERNQVADALSQHYSDGRLDANELKERLDRAIGAKTRGDLSGLLTDLPPLAPPAPPPPTRRRRVAFWVACAVCRWRRSPCPGRRSGGRGSPTSPGCSSGSSPSSPGGPGGTADTTPSCTPERGGGGGAGKMPSSRAPYAREGGAGGLIGPGHADLSGPARVPRRGRPTPHRVVRGKTMAWHTVNEHGDGRTALTVRAQAGENELLATSEPERYFLPRYVARYGYVGIYLDVADIDWDEIRRLPLRRLPAGGPEVAGPDDRLSPRRTRRAPPPTVAPATAPSRAAARRSRP